MRQSKSVFTFWLAGVVSLSSTSQALAKDIVLKAFEHPPSGYVLFQVESTEALDELRRIENRTRRSSRQNISVVHGDRWYFGKASEREFTRLPPLPGLRFFSSTQTVEVNFTFNMTDAASGQVVPGLVSGRIAPSPDDAMTRVGQVEIRCGELKSGCMPFSEALARELTEKLESGRMELIEPDPMFRKLKHALIDELGNTYLIDTEESAVVDAERDVLAGRAATVEVIRISADGVWEFLEVSSYREPAEEIRRSLGYPYVPTLRIEFKNGDVLQLPPIRSEAKEAKSYPSQPFLLTEGTERGLQEVRLVPSPKGSFAGLANRYRTGFLNPCLLMLAAAGE